MKTIGAAVLLVCVAGSAAAQEVQDPSLEFVFEEIVTLGPAVSLGQTAKGNRRYIPITGGTVEGPGVRGEVLPGGWDWQLDRPDGCTEIEADYFLKMEDGTVINVVNKGALCRPGEDGEAIPVRTYPVFEAPIGKWDWMSKTAFVGTLEMAPPSAGPAVRIRFYRAK